MAAKYWYVAGNGSADWSVAANWYLGSGGTGGAAGLPTASDTVYLSQASGSGTLTIGSGTTALCNSLICTGFSGTLAGTTSLTITDTTSILAQLLEFSPNMGITYSGTFTINGSGDGNSIIFNGQTFPGNITLAKSATTGSTQVTFVDTARITGLLTISSGFIFFTSQLFTGRFSMSGTGSSTNRDISGGTIYLTGSGAVLTVSTTGTYSSNLLYELTDTTSNTKTLVSTVTTASGFEPFIDITGGGTGSYSLTGNFANISVNNSGGGTFSFGASNIWSLFFNSSNVNWNNAVIALAIRDALYLSSNMTVTATPTITFNGQSTVRCNTKRLTGAVSVTLGNTLIAEDAFRLANTLTLTNGSFSGGDAYINSISSSSSNFRDITITNLYLTGTGTLVTTTTTTNLSVLIGAIYIQDTSNTGLAKTLTFNSIFGSSTVYIAGTGTGLITLAAANTLVPYVYVTNIGGTVSFTSGTIGNLVFLPGTTCTWSNAASQTLNIVNDLTFAVGQPLSTLTPILILNQGTSNITMNGNRLVTGALTAGYTSGATIFTDNFTTNAAVTITDPYTDSAAAGNFTCSTLTLTGSGTFNFKKNITATVTTIGGSVGVTIAGLISPGVYFQSVVNITTLTVSAANSDPLTINGGTFTCTSISNSSAYPISISGGSTLNCSSISLTAGSSLNAYENSIIRCTGAFLSTAGNVNFTNSTATFLTFGLSGVTSNYNVNNSKIYITGATTTAFSLAATIASYTSDGTSIEFTNTANTNTTFAGGGFTYDELIFNRGAVTGFNNIITGNNTFTNLRDFGTAQHFLLFPSGGITTIGHLDVHGAPGAVITIGRSGTIGVSTLTKSPAGLVICNYVAVVNVPVSETNTWYAGPNSTVTNSANWINSGKVRKQGALGVG